MDEVANAGMEFDLFDDNDADIEKEEKKSKVLANSDLELDLFDDNGVKIEKEEKKSKVQKK